MKIVEFVENYKAQRFMTATKNGVDEKIEYFRKELEPKELSTLVVQRRADLSRWIV